MVKDVLRRAARFARGIVGKDVFTRRDVRIRRLLLGGPEGEGGWTIHPDVLDSSAIVYSAGIGTDISFDLEIIRMFGLEVHAFDPTPRSILWLEQQVLPSEFHFHPIAIAGTSTKLILHTPTNPDFVSFSEIRHAGASGEEIAVEARRLSNIMQEERHDRIGLLKMDIEGSEYGVIDDFISSNVAVDQLLVEFHHRFDSIETNCTRKAIQMLRDAGYQLFHVSARGEEYSFIHDSILPGRSAA